MSTSGTRRARRAQPIPAVVAVLGEEEFLVERTVRDVVAAATARDADTDVRELDASSLMPGDLVELASPTLFGGTRLLVIRAADKLPKAVAEEIVAYAAIPADDVVLVVVAGGGAKGRGLVGELRRAGAHVIERPALTRYAERLDFVRAEMRRLDRMITEDGARALVEAVGTDLRALAGACDQLAADTTGTVDERLVARYYRGRAEASGFMVADCAVEGRLADALEQVRWAANIGVAPVLVISALAGGLRSLARIVEAPPGLRGPALAREIGVPAWKVNRLRQQASAWSPAGLTRALNAVADADALVKGGGADPQYALERVLQQIVAARSGGTPRRAR